MDRSDNSVAGEYASLIEDACARNAPVELQYRAADGERLIAKSRVLGVDAERVFLDAPHSIGQDVVFQRDQELEGYLLINEVRYAFKSRVRELDAMVRINAEKRTVGMVIDRPDSVVEGQRRTHFRVSVIANEPIQIQIHGAIPGSSGACPVDAHVFEASLVNLSVGGAGLRVSPIDCRTIRVGDDLFMTFHLPEEDQEFYFLTEVRQIWAIPGDAAKRVGVKIKPWPSPRDIRRTQQRLQRYITQVQRARLRRAG